MLDATCPHCGFDLSSWSPNGRVAHQKRCRRATRAARVYFLEHGHWAKARSGGSPPTHARSRRTDGQQAGVKRVARRPS